MRSKFLEQTKVIADGTTAFDRTGFDSAKIIVLGGTAEADIKLQSGDSAAQTDYVILGESEGAGEVVNFDVDLSGCGSYVKVAGTSLTNVFVVLGDAYEDPCTTNKVIG